MQGFHLKRPSATDLLLFRIVEDEQGQGQSKHGAEDSKLILATSAAVERFAKKRPYLNDYKPFTECLTFKNVSFQITKAGILSFSAVMVEYNQYLDRAIAAEARGDATLPVNGFNWNRCLSNHWPQFTTMSSRFLGTAIIKKTFEAVAVAQFSAKTADRLTKDLVKSLSRKIQKYGRLGASQHMLVTSLRSSILLNASQLTYDILFNFVEAWRRRRWSQYSVKQIVVWASKKTIFYCVGMTFSAVGFAVGSLISAEVGSQLLAALFESGGLILAGNLLGL